ncbi:hypothetical protein X943_000814 [Babesia divergens]|uniref:Chloroquine resistance transporter n=1 Tax=Babesia divergens TaxID=32595 RepID=A0AAD9G6L4_BABDI|nr:hypothetical protein X943_000814 [Babesia divergens]
MIYHGQDSEDSSVVWGHDGTNALASDSSSIRGIIGEPRDGSTADWGLPSRAVAIASNMAHFLRKKQLIIASVVYVIMDVFLTVYYKMVMDHTSNYTLVTMETLTMFIFVVFSVIYAACKYLLPQYMERPFNYRPLLTLSLLDILSNGLSALGSARTSGILLTMLGQIIIPLTMFSSKLMLGKHYNGYQYLGAFMIVTFVAIKEVTLPPSSESNDLKSNIIFLTASVPDSIAASIRSAQYSSESFHLIKYQHFASASQFVMGIPIFAVLMANQLTRPELGFLGGIMHDIKAGLACLYLGHNTIIDQCGSPGLPGCDNCEGGLKVLALYMLTNIIIRLAYIVIMMHGAVTLTFLLGALKVPLCSIAFSIPFISGESASQFDITDVYCFLGIMCSLFIYGIGSRLLTSSHSAAAEPMLQEFDRSDCSLFERSTQSSIETRV